MIKHADFVNLRICRLNILIVTVMKIEMCVNMFVNVSVSLRMRTVTINILSRPFLKFDINIQ